MNSMNAVRPKLTKNLLETRDGTARFYSRGGARPNWRVRFHVGGQTWMQSAGDLYPCADGLESVKVWASEVMRTRLLALREGKLEEIVAVTRRAREVMLSELRRVYLQHVPPGRPDYRKNVNRLCAIWEEVTGLECEDIPVSEALWTREALLGWVRMRQEHFRRGWTVPGAEPVDAWARLRADLRARSLPGIDKTTVMECNTTVQTYLRCAKSVFANSGEYLLGLKLPDLVEFRRFAVDLAAPKGHREMDEAAVLRMREDSARLARERPEVWAFHVLVGWTGARPVTLKALRGDALLVLADGTGKVLLPGTKGGNAVRVDVDAEAVEALRAVMTAESLIGARHKTDATRIHLEHNAWMRACGVTGTLMSYLFRHARLQQLRTVFDVETAATGAGHTTTAMVRRVYTRGSGEVPLLRPAV
jgi:hypothetical protein